MAWNRLFSGGIDGKWGLDPDDRDARTLRGVDYTRALRADYGEALGVVSGKMCRQGTGGFDLGATFRRVVEMPGSQKSRSSAEREPALDRRKEP